MGQVMEDAFFLCSMLNQTCHHRFTSMNYQSITAECWNLWNVNDMISHLYHPPELATLFLYKVHESKLACRRFGVEYMMSQSSPHLARVKPANTLQMMSAPF